MWGGQVGSGEFPLAAQAGLNEDSVYCGAWACVPVLRRVLRSMLRYLGSVWLFAQIPPVLGLVFPQPSGRGGIVCLDAEQPALRFYCG